MERSCAVCGRAFNAQRATAKYCGSSCRARASQAGGVPDVTPAPLSSGDLAATTLKRLADAGVLDTVEGQAALLLARRMDSGNDSGSSIAALNRELHATVERALSLGSVAADPMDELRARRERRNAS